MSSSFFFQGYKRSHGIADFWQKSLLSSLKTSLSKQEIKKKP
ncbi:MAG: hypothetical protein ACW98X_24655 [Promethearchaeota archaeon]